MAASAQSLPIRLEIQDGIAIIQMINDENKWNGPFSQLFNEILVRVESNPSVKFLVIVGEGKFFSYGLDLPWMAQQSSEVLVKFFASMDKLVMKITTFPMPTIAAVNGHAFGMGAILAMSCDYRVMTTGRGWFCFPETKLQLEFSYTTLELIKLKLTNSQIIRDAALYSKRYAGAEAARAQVVDEAVEGKDLLPTAIRIGKEVVGDGLDRITVAACKDKLYGAPIRAAREKDSQRYAEGNDLERRLNLFRKGASRLPSKM